MHCSVQETPDRKSHPNLPAESSAVLISGFVQKRCCVRRFHELGNAHNACRHDATSTTRTRNLHTHIIVGRNAPSNANNTECKYMRRAHTRHPTGHTSYLTVVPMSSHHPHISPPSADTTSPQVLPTPPDPRTSPPRKPTPSLAPPLPSSTPPLPSSLSWGISTKSQRLRRSRPSRATPAQRR